MDKILEVKNLKISFRTQGGTLKAVRDISFDLERGKTLAIVGESGSGKSVTSKAVLGILAGNSITEGGEIIYDGRDLLKISEEEMCTIRGNRISMIFQDPLSSLNPIVKIGQQITEAMLLKNKGNRKSARKDFNTTLALLKNSMIAALGLDKKNEITEMCSTFDKFNIEGIKLENSYNNSVSEAEGLVSEIEDLLFMAEKKQKIDYKARFNEIFAGLKMVKDPFMMRDYSSKLSEATSNLKNAVSAYTPAKKNEEFKEFPEILNNALNNLKAVLGEILAAERPNFFRIGYYKLKNPQFDLTSKSVSELNALTLDYLNEDFMFKFIDMEKKGLKYSFDVALAKKKELMPKLYEARDFYKKGEFDKNSADKVATEVASLVENSIDRLELNKDSVAYTFRTTLLAAIDKYFVAIKKNPQEEARFERQSKKRDALIAKGKHVEWKVVPKSVYDLDELKTEITNVVERMIGRYEAYIEAAPTVDFEVRGVEMIDYFKAKASEVVYKVTKRMAKEKAIKLMEEVGIPDPRIRYYQYPFEFSGGMRQRIVIAIALAADPDILICDEPTTALDVTIQAQILELINNLKRERNLSVIFITHDLGVVANMADDIAVMYAGKIVEYGSADDVFYDPRHPYTWALLASMPDLDTKEKLDAIPGTPPNMIYPPVGDAFADRNKYAMQIDFEQQPPKFKVNETHWAATWLLHPNAPKVEPPRIVTDRIERMTKTGGTN